MPQLELRGLLDGEGGRLGALEDLVDEERRAPEVVSDVRSTGHQTPELHRLPPAEAAWQPSPRREVNDVRSIGIGRWSTRDEERLGPGAADQREGLGVLTGCEHGQHQRHAQRLRDRPNARCSWALPVVVFLAGQIGDARNAGQHLSQELQALALEFRPDSQREPRDVAAGSREALNDPLAHWVAAGCHDDGDAGGHRLGRQRQRATDRQDHVRVETDELRDDVAESLGPSVGRSALQDEVLPFHIAEGSQALQQRSGPGVDGLGPSHGGHRARGQDEADPIDLPRRLRVGSERRGQEAAGDHRHERSASEVGGGARAWIGSLHVGDGNPATAPAGRDRGCRGSRRRSASRGPRHT